MRLTCGICKEQFEAKAKQALGVAICPRCEKHLWGEADKHLLPLKLEWEVKK